LAVYRINMVMASYRQRFPKSQPVIILDMSKRGGGPVQGHMTHMDGRDVDIPLVLEQVQDIARVTQRTVDLERTWFLIKAFVDSCDVDHIFLDRALQRSLRERALQKGHTAQELGLILQYPAGERSMAGIVRHWPNHKDHMHVHFRQERTPLLPAAKRYCEWRKQKTAP
jgi:murein endopeptidase